MRKPSSKPRIPVKKGYYTIHFSLIGYDVEMWYGGKQAPEIRLQMYNITNIFEHAILNVPKRTNK